ncbi:MAG: hypothetical protein VYD87_10985 [Pseudomonadota bacterium]|nr:hypothetical protein [Pseudomonadota bacterium]
MTYAATKLLEVLRDADRGDLPLWCGTFEGGGSRPERVVAIRTAVERGFLTSGAAAFETTPAGRAWRSALVASVLAAAGMRG